MLSSRIFFKNYLASSAAEHGLNTICNAKKHVKFNNILANFNNRMIRTATSKYFLLKRKYFGLKYSSYGYSSMQTVVFPKNENVVPVESSFQEMMHNRKSQAHRSVLIAVANKADIPFAIACLEKYGSIANICSYPGETENCFLLAEFLSESSTQNFLLNCGFQNVSAVYPVSSRILQYKKKPNNMPSNTSINLREESSSELIFNTKTDVSEVISKMYSNEKLKELDIRLRFLLCSLMKDSISGMFPFCDVVPFGSSVNGVGKSGCDLDVAIRLYPEKMNYNGEFSFLTKACDGKKKNLQQRALYRLGEYFLFSPGLSISEKVMFARVPILKMQHKILNIDFDVSVNNMSAVLMSEMLYFCGEIDSRVRPLIHVIKKWAKESNITLNKAGYQISNFGLTNLVLFFLQTRRPHPVLPPLSDAFIIHDSYDSCSLQYLKSLEEWQNFAALNKETLAVLLKEFLVFLSSYPFHEKVISLLSGETRTRDEISVPLYVEYPLDEALNVTKNVSTAEYDVMCEKARISAKGLENNFNQTVKTEKDFLALLQIPSISRISIKSNKFNVSEVFENGKNSRNRNIKHRS